jgi:putative copper export protein
MTSLEVSVRWIHLASVLLLVGTFSFELFISRPVFKTVGAQMSLHFASFYKAQFRITRLSLLLAIGTAVLGLFIKIASVTGLSLSESFDLGAIMNVLTGTRFGIVWLVRMVLCCLLAAMMSAEFFGWLKSDSVWLRVAEFVLSATLLMAVAAAGHASSRRRSDTFHSARYGRASSLGSRRVAGRADSPGYVVKLG